MLICDYCQNPVSILEEHHCIDCASPFHSCCDEIRFCPRCREEIIHECPCGLYYDQPTLTAQNGMCCCGTQAVSNMDKE